MPLVLRKFLSNKIESTRDDWEDYLLGIAAAYASFDGGRLNHRELARKFASINRNKRGSEHRDPDNFRDEFGAYGSYLGICWLEKSDAAWIVRLTEAARMFLCCTEPNVPAFCRAQLSLFQYPNGLGTAYSKNGKCRVQANIASDTLGEISARLKVAPFRLALRAILALAASQGTDAGDVRLGFQDLWALINDPRTNQTVCPTYGSIIEVVGESMSPQYRSINSWLTNKTLLSRFARNFHIVNHTDLLMRLADNGGLSLVDGKPETVELARRVSSLTAFYDGFDTCDSAEDLVREVESGRWGRFYDGANLPFRLLSDFSDPIVPELSVPTVIHEGASCPNPAFPAMHDYEPEANRSRDASHTEPSDPMVTAILREKANLYHQSLANKMAALSRNKGATVKENQFVDLDIELEDTEYLVEVKSCNAANLLSQVRRGVSQLYEYRYRYGKVGVELVLLLQENPSTVPWLENYITMDRHIHLIWQSDDGRLVASPQSVGTLSLLLA